METFEVCYERYADLGYGMFLRSSTRGTDLAGASALVAATGLRDIEFGSAFTAELAWRIGSDDDGKYRGIAAALRNDDLESFVQGMSQSRVPQAHPPVRPAGQFYVFSFASRHDLDALATGPVADQIIYLPRFPECDLAATTSREEVEWSLYDPQAKFESVIADIAQTFDLPCVEVSKTNVELESLVAMQAYVARIESAVNVGKPRK